MYPDGQLKNNPKYAWIYDDFPDASDTSEQRLKYFKSGLSALGDYVAEHPSCQFNGLEVLKFPANIGCGLGGGR